MSSAGWIAVPRHDRVSARVAEIGARQSTPPSGGVSSWCARHGAQRRDWRYSSTHGGGWMTWWCKSTRWPGKGNS